MVEPCRSQVEEELAMDRVLTCTTATYICSAEPACNTALQYYNNYCTDMFTGHHSTPEQTETRKNTKCFLKIQKPNPAQQLNPVGF